MSELKVTGTDEQRRRFEKWATTSRTEGMFWTRKALARDEDIYYNESIQFAWESWQSAQPTPQVCEEIARKIAEKLHTDAFIEGEWAKTEKAVLQILTSQLLGEKESTR